MAETKKNDDMVTVVNSGVSLIVFGGVRYSPDAEFEVKKSDLEKSSFQYLIASGQLEIKDDSEATKEIRTKVNGSKKKDPDEGKTQKELENGGEY